MNLSKLKQIIKEEIRKQIVLKEKYEPSVAPERTKEKEKEKETTQPIPKRRTLAPPKESPDTKPKALMKENEKDLVSKIAQRFKKLNK
jgi:hypothetical protein